jgi:ATP-dependent DNA helicase RecG
VSLYIQGKTGLRRNVNKREAKGTLLALKRRSNVSELAVRELVANAIIHQDFSLRGTGPMIEVFTDRMEITNPGVPLVQTERFLDLI